MYISRTILQGEVLHNREFPMGSIVLTLDNKMQLVCWKFNHSRKQNLELFVWMPKENKWVMTYEKNEYTEMMWDYYRKCQKKHKKYRINYAQLMHPGEKGKETKSQLGTKGKRKKIPSSVVWAAKHPFRGGGFSPR